MHKLSNQFLTRWILLLLTVLLLAVSSSAYAAAADTCTSTPCTGSPGTNPQPSLGTCTGTQQCYCHVKKGATSGTGVCADGAGINQWAQSFFKNFLSPFYTMIVATSRIIGIFMIFWGLMRLRRMGHHSMMHRLSPISTTMFFVVGAIFAAFSPELMMFSGSIFSGLPDMGQQYTGANQHLMAPCGALYHTKDAVSGLERHQFCPVMGYYTALVNNTSADSQPEQTMLQVVYALLLVVGVISFLRGCLFLLRLGEGNTSDGSMVKAITFILAGIIGINAHDFQLLMGGLIPHNLIT